MDAWKRNDRYIFLVLKLQSFDVKFAIHPFCYASVFMMKLTKKQILKEMKKYPPFYQKAWKACMTIPPGQTRSYKWLAARAGNPKAARAAAIAMKNNPFAPLVPCHRVIRSDGSIGGYSGPGGIKRKMRLLRKESQRKKSNQ